MTQNRTSIRLVAVVLALAFITATAAVAQTGVLFVKGDRVGVKTGASTPGGALHVVNSGTPIAEPFPGISLILQNSSTPTSAAFFTLLAGNAANSQMAFGDTDNPFAGQLLYQHGTNKYQFRIGGVTYAEISASGLTTITPGGACNPGPCDGTFAPDYEVESIEEHAEYMWENKHLWGVGPTPDDGPINLTTTTTGMLHELEKAHIYIEQLHSELKGLRSEMAELKAKVEDGK